MDTGTNGILTPNAVYNAIIAATKAVPNALGYPYVDCSTVSSLPNLTFTFSGGNQQQQYTLPPSAYTYQVQYYRIETSDPFIGFGEPDDYVTVCVLRMSNFTSLGDSATWIIGLPFFEQYYTVFDIQNKTIAFATSVPVLTPNTSVSTNSPSNYIPSNYSNTSPTSLPIRSISTRIYVTQKATSAFVILLALAFMCSLWNETLH